VTSAQSVVRAPANTDNVAAATFLDHVVARGDDVAQRIREVAPNGVDALVDCAALHDLIVPAVRDGGSIATPRWYSAPMIAASPGTPSSFPTTQPATTFLENFATSSRAGCSAPPSPKPFPHTKPHSHTKSSRQEGSADASSSPGD
jgi:hypothetical protein